MTGAELQRHAAELGIDVVGAAPAAPYETTERAILERRERGLFGRMRFTIARPEVSCHPERLLAGGRTVVSAALCYYAPAPPPHPGEGRLPRYAWRDRYRELRERLDGLGRRLGGAYRVLVDDNDHVDREGAVRAGLGFYGKNTVLITRRHGSWVALGTLVTAAEVEPSAPVPPGCGSCTRCIDACPTGALDEPGVLDATRCLSYLTQAPGTVPEQYRGALGARVYGCDICQEVCPWNRGIERRRAGERAGPGDEPAVSLREWLEADPAELRRRYARLYVPGNDGRHLQRNALVAAGNAGDRSLAPLLRRHARGGDELLSGHARWALERLAGGDGTPDVFSRSADLYDAIYAFKDYRAEAGLADAAIRARNPNARTLLDVACGTGKHLEHLRGGYEVEGLDLDPALLAIARARLPGVPLHEADMTSFELGRRFDAVTCLFSAIAYTRTVERLDAAVGTMASHLEPGGVLAVEPWILPGAWLEEAVHAVFVDEPDLKVARVNTGVPLAPQLTLEFHYLVGRPGGVERFEERHEVGMFSHEDYLRALERAGLAAEHDPEGLTGRGLYLGVLP